MFYRLNWAPSLASWHIPQCLPLGTLPRCVTEGRRLGSDLISLPPTNRLLSGAQTVGNQHLPAATGQGTALGTLAGAAASAKHGVHCSASTARPRWSPMQPLRLLLRFRASHPQRLAQAGKRLMRAWIKCMSVCVVHTHRTGTPGAEAGVCVCHCKRLP